MPAGRKAQNAHLFIAHVLQQADGPFGIGKGGFPVAGGYPVIQHISGNAGPLQKPGNRRPFMGGFMGVSAAGANHHGPPAAFHGEGVQRGLGLFFGIFRIGSLCFPEHDFFSH